MIAAGVETRLKYGKVKLDSAPLPKVPDKGMDSNVSVMETGTAAWNAVESV